VEASSPGSSRSPAPADATNQVADIELTLVSGEEVITDHRDWSGVPPPPPETGSVATINPPDRSRAPGRRRQAVTESRRDQAGFVVDALGNVLRARQSRERPVPDRRRAGARLGRLLVRRVDSGRMIQNLEIYTGGMPAEFGDRLGCGRQSFDSASDRFIPKAARRSATARSTRIEPGCDVRGQAHRQIGMFAGGSYVSSDRALDAPSIEPLHDTGSTGRVFARVDWQQCDCNRYELFCDLRAQHLPDPARSRATPFDPNNRGRRTGSATTPRRSCRTNTNATETEDELFAALSFTHKLDMAS